MKNVIQIGQTKIEYFQKGHRPTLLIDSGMHGDEYQVIGSVQKAVEKYYAALPDFIYIPEVAPSAVALRTRNTKEGYDVNRSFYTATKVPEARAMLQIIKGHQFDLSISFHEDYEREHQFYLYDSGAFTDLTPWRRFNNQLADIGVDLYTGYDDTTDPNLGYYFHNGYRSLSQIENSREDGNFWSYAYRHGIARRLLMPEVPKLASQEIKDQIVDAIFATLVLPLSTEPSSRTWQELELSLAE